MSEETSHDLSNTRTNAYWDPFGLLAMVRNSLFIGSVAFHWVKAVVPDPLNPPHNYLCGGFLPSRPVATSGPAHIVRRTFPGY